MIASNYRKHPDALALQLPLPFPHRLTWQTARPGNRTLRLIRAARAAAFKAAGRIAYPIKQAVPAWWKEAKRRARSLADNIHAACRPLVAEIRVSESLTDTRLLGFNYEDDLAAIERKALEPRQVKRECWNCNATTWQTLKHTGTCTCNACGCRSTIGQGDEDDAPEDDDQQIVQLSDQPAWPFAPIYCAECDSGTPHAYQGSRKWRCTLCGVITDR